VERISAASGGSDMAKFKQICASQDDLFALDEDGNVYQYNFHTKTWIKLAVNRSEQKTAGPPSLVTSG
jgi:hypothetical protein